MTQMPMCSVIIPTIGKSRMIIELLQQLEEQQDEVLRAIYVIDNGMPEKTRDDCRMFKHVKIVDGKGLGIYQMWNLGVMLVRSVFPHDYIAVFNDDLILDVDKFLSVLIEPLDNQEDIWAVCGNYDHRDFAHYYQELTGTYKDKGFAGFCFVVKGEAYADGLPFFEEAYHWWFGDDDFVHSVHKCGKSVAMTRDAWMTHIDNGSNTIVQYTPEFNEKVAVDQQIYNQKWHSHD